MVGKKINFIAILLSVLSIFLFSCQKDEGEAWQPKYISKAGAILQPREEDFFDKMPDYLTARFFSEGDLAFFRKINPSVSSVYHFFFTETNPALAVTLPAKDSVKFHADTLWQYDGHTYYQTAGRDKPYYYFFTDDYGIVCNDKILTERLIRTLPEAFVPDSTVNDYLHYTNSEASAHWMIFPLYAENAGLNLFHNDYLFKHAGDVLIWDVENPGERAYSGVSLTQPPHRHLEDVFREVESYEIRPENFMPAGTTRYLAVSFDVFEPFYRAWTDFKTYSGYRNNPLNAKDWKALKGITQGGSRNEFLITRFSSVPDAVFKRLRPAFRHNDMDVYISPDSSRLAQLMYPLMHKKSYPYVAVLDNDWIWTTDASVMRRILNAVAKEKTFDRTKLYKQHLSQGGPYHLKALNNNRYYTFKYDENILFVSYQFIDGAGNMPAAKTSAWTSVGKMKFSAGFQTDPKWVYNHRTGKYEIIFQDKQNHLTLTDAKGKQKWKLLLNQPINSEIYQVDMFKNGKRQFLFSTPKGIYTVDIKGNYVSPFPLHKNLSSPVAVFDYDKNKRYRLMFAENNTVRVYDIKGQPVKGFKPVRLTAPLQFAPQHIRIGNKDYILLQQTDGTLRILDRRGNDRIKIKEKIRVVRPWQSHKGKFVSVDTDGRPVSIDTRGRIQRDSTYGKITEADFQARHSLLVTDKGILLDGKKVSLPPGDYIEPSIFVKGKDVYYTLVDKGTKQVLLIDKKRRTEKIPGDYQAELLIKPKTLYLLTRYSPDEILIYSRPK